MRGALAFVCLLVVAAEAHAQKPVGVFDAGPNPPAWAQFGTISDTVSDDRFREAAALSRSRPFLWVLGLGYWERPDTPIGPHAARVLARLEATGLLPYVVAMSVGEEWYEIWLSGGFASYGLAADHPDGVPIIRDWLGRQHAAAKASLGLPVIWITGIANNDPARVPYRPIPDHTDYVAVEAYVPAGGTFAAHVAPYLAHAETTTHLPLVLIPQWFRIPGDPLWHVGPSPSDIAEQFRWFSRPRWAAMLGFTWRTRAHGIIGAEDMPAIRAAIEEGVSRR